MFLHTDASVRTCTSCDDNATVFRLKFLQPHTKKEFTVSYSTHDAIQ